MAFQNTLSVPSRSVFSRLLTVFSPLRPCLFPHLLFSALLLPSLPAADRILNQAAGEYIDPRDASVIPLLSNIVEVQVLDTPGMRLRQDNSLISIPGSTIAFSHVLTNTGNLPATYSFSLTSTTPQDFPLQQVRLYLDSNANGLPDSGETLLAEWSPPTATRAQVQPLPRLHSLSSLPLAPSASATLCVTAFVPSTASDGQQSAIRLAAFDQTNQLSATNTDLVTVRDTSAIIYKSVSAHSARRQEEITWNIVFQNSSPLAPIGLTVDGQPAHYVVVRDIIPVNTTFSRFVENFGAHPLYHLAGDLLHAYRSTPPPDLRQVDAVAWGFTVAQPNQRFAVSFATTINSNASGEIPNTASLHFQKDSLVELLASNRVQVSVPLAPPVIRYFTTELFEDIAPFTRLGQELFIQADAATCNLDPLVVEIVTIGILSDLTGDEESFLARETGPNTGVFRILPAVPTADAHRVVVEKRNGTLESLTGDVLTASIRECGGTITSTTILVDPFGVVFDSLTNRPISGARVTLIDITGEGNGGFPNQPAIVIAEDLRSPAPSTLITGADGIFFFPLIRSSTYRVQIEPPPTHTFPSTVPVGKLTGRVIDQNASYGKSFVVRTSDLNIIVFDVPLDPKSAPGFVLSKEVSRELAEIGDSVLYTLTLKNSTGAPLSTTYLDDHLPIGFFYEPGSTRIDRQPAQDPSGAPGPNLRFFLGHVPEGVTKSISYRVRLGPGAQRGDGINRAQAISYGPPILTSNEATARVDVEEGVFTDRGVLFGRVFVDLDGDLLPSEQDLGVPGVRIYLEDGTFAITDSEGKYSLYGLRPLPHIAKPDPLTLPAESQLLVVDSRHASDPASRFADMKHGELHKANFALAPTPAVIAAVEARRSLARKQPGEIANILDRRFETNDRRSIPSEESRVQSSGIIGNSDLHSQIPFPPSTFTPLLPAHTLHAGNSNLPSSASVLPPAIPLEIYAAQIVHPEPGFLDLQDGDTLPTNVANVRVKGRQGATFQLVLNGHTVSNRRIGKNLENPSTGVRIAEYVGLDFQPGANTLQFSQTDSYGNPRGGQTIQLFAPAALGQIRLAPASLSPTNDQPVEVTITLEDADGRRIHTRTPLTLETSYGRWNIEDLNPVEPGVQVFLQGGQATFTLLPEPTPATARIVVSSGLIRTEELLRFRHPVRPFLVAGVAEVRWNQNFDSPSAAPTSASFSPFEDVVSDLAAFDDGSLTGRIAAFAKGEIQNGWLLTASYDSAKQRGGKFFRDIEPDQFYPVYGDDSIRGFEAQSTSPLFARLEKDHSFLQWGDFTTHPVSPGANTAAEVRSLGAYNRTLTGLYGHYEDGRLSANAWAAHASSRQVIEEIPADGTSGPFAFSPAGGGLRNSETVEVITRDRNQPGLILESRILTRFTDYEFEPFSGRLLLRSPLASYDSNFNPQSIRITYELQNPNGQAHWVWGADASYQLFPWWEIGVTYAKDENPAELYELTSANSTFRLARDTYLLAEVARSQSIVEGEGFAGRMEIRHKDAHTDARLYAGKAENSFLNHTALLTAGRLEAGIEATRRLDTSTDLKVYGIYSEEVSGSGNRQGIRADISHTLPHQLNISAGARVSRDSSPITNLDPQNPKAEIPTLPPEHPTTVTSLRLRVTSPIPRLAGSNIYGEIENDLQDTDRRILALGGDYQVKPQTRFYARHEFINSLGSEFAINSTQENHRTLIGAESTYMRDGTIFNEYRVRDAINARESEASTGLRNKWDVAPGLDLQTTFERITPFDGKQTVESTAGTIAAAYTQKENWKTSGRFEVRHSDTALSFLQTIGYARKLTLDWTFLARTIYYQLDSKAAGSSQSTGTSGSTSTDISTSSDIRQFRLLTGAAYRPVADDTWNALLRYEFKYEDGSQDFDDSLERLAHIGSLSWNWQPVRSFTLSSRYAAKYVEEFRPEGDSSYIGQLLGARALLDVTKRLDLGLSASIFFHGGTDSFEYALGPEIGVNFKKNMRFSLGYNFFGYYDRDFDDLVNSRQGFFLTLRIKFDENFFRDLWGGGEEEEK